MKPNQRLDRGPSDVVTHLAESALFWSQPPSHQPQSSLISSLESNADINEILDFLWL